MHLLLIDMRLFLIQLCLKVSLLLVKLCLEVVKLCLAVSLLLRHLLICLLYCLLLARSQLLRDFELITKHLDVSVFALIHGPFTLQFHLDCLDLETLDVALSETTCFILR